MLTAEVSIGAAIRDASLGSTDELLNRFDVALCQAKTRDNGSVVVYDDRLHQRHVDAQALERDVSQAMHAQAFTFHFKPIGDLAMRTVENFEMLIRWSHPKRGMLSPDSFSPIIDRLGLTKKLDHLVAALIGLVGELELDLVFEGAENQTQIDIVRSAGCTVLQGFALAHPLPLDRAHCLGKGLR